MKKFNLQEFKEYTDDYKQTLIKFSNSRYAYLLFGTWIFIILKMDFCSFIMILFLIQEQCRNFYRYSKLSNKKLIKKIGMKKIEFWYYKEVEVEFYKYFQPSQLYGDDLKIWKETFNLEKSRINSIIYYYKRLCETETETETFLDFERNYFIFRVANRLYIEEKRDRNIKMILK